MKYIIGSIVSVVFVIYGIVSIFSPSTIKNRMNKHHKAALTDWGAGETHAEEYVKANVVQRTISYRIIGLITLILGSLLLFAVVKELLKS